MPELQTTVSPVNSEKYVEREYLSPVHFDAITTDARVAFQTWKKTSIEERVACVQKFVDVFESMKQEAAREIVWQMGRPVRYAAGEVGGLKERALCMTALAKESLSDHELPSTNKPGFRRFIRREPLGVVLILPAWNFPLLTAVNGVVPAILAGNSVILKHSFQTPLSAERFAEAFKQAGLPEKVLQVVHVSYEDTHLLVKHPLVDYVNFTGSVQTGRTIQQAANSEKFIGCGLELGGKDPAYVRADCDLTYAVEQIVDGAYFNSGQSCCGIERIYVHKNLYDPFVERFVEEVKKYKLGDPTEIETTLGPLVRTSAADEVRRVIAEAIAQGAKPLIDRKLFPKDQAGTPYLAPQVLVNVNHTMKVMTEETFGPVVGIMKVDNDEEAIRLMNDSQYGLTASIWSKDEDAAVRIGDQLETGTVFLNRCDYLDPELAWVGVKNSGRGCTLSKYGFDNLTRPKSFHLKVGTA